MSDPMLAGGCEYCSEGIMQGTLYVVCSYPGAIQSNSANDKVFGELYQLLDRDRFLAGNGLICNDLLTLNVNRAPSFC